MKTWDVEPGPYKVKARRGTAIFEQVVLVRPGAETFTVPHLAFASPSPIPGTAWIHDHHISADLDAATRDPDIRHGEGSAIVIMAREWTEPHKSETRPPLNPARGLSLLTVDGEKIADLDDPPHHDPGWEPWATCHVAVAPGAYRLRLESPDRVPVEMTVIASAGWQTHVYLLTETPRPREHRTADLVNGTISLRRRDEWNDPKAMEQAWQLEEIVRQALIDDRTRLCSFLESQLELDDPTPMLALYGAHVLVNEARKRKLQRERDASLPEIDHRPTVARIVQRLRELLGHDHPDVESLAFGADVGNPAYRCTVPPMLRGSWLRLLSESTRTDILAADSFAQKIEGRLWGDGPWLLWMAPDTEDVFDRDAVWMARAEVLIAEALEKNRATAPVTESPATFRERLSAGIEELRQRITKPNLPAFPESTPASAVVPETRALDVAAAREFLRDPENCKAVVKAIGLPGTTIRRWLEEHR